MEHTISNQSQLRLRVFAGPNGSGKSTVIKSIGTTLINGKPLYLGIYVNADDIAVAIKNGQFDFSTYEIECSKEEILLFAATSGLLTASFNEDQIAKSFHIETNRLYLLAAQYAERLAQIIARLLREKLLLARKRFSFETVFSHESNLDIMRAAAEQGYKVYLYFVSTEDPEINKYRVALRVRKNGHNVPSDRIESRYYRSLQLVKQASELAYQAFFFDNSIDNEPYKLVGHFKRVGAEKIWYPTNINDTSNWFRKYCI
ncbi:hypothetical protein LZG74_10070 [Dyadobacter sp. CY327]|uniref:hypothetical protein n=1 Tax=Dyadobacter sp. CY327 TaxID=2907301 RepID=UPI001F3DB164|nr:hypothetical protein [Dyadobacter sp. CY327]MCE7070650.1 hypothetical protein [Dyadobacter sp. CY327]